jgi:peptidoglycan-associated lipoprotein
VFVHQGKRQTRIGSQARDNHTGAGNHTEHRREPSGTIPAKRTVYFDFDSNAIKDEYTPVIQAHAKFLIDNRNRRVRVEGHTDERGSREYNLALGQRRSDAVKRSLSVLGVAESRIDSVSFGEEKPTATGHDEASWQQNRRGDLKYEGEK